MSDSDKRSPERAKARNAERIARLIRRKREAALRKIAERRAQK